MAGPGHRLGLEAGQLAPGVTGGWKRYSNPRRAAWATAAARDETLSLLKMLATWRWIV